MFPSHCAPGNDPISGSLRAAFRHDIRNRRGTRSVLLPDGPRRPQSEPLRVLWSWSKKNDSQSQIRAAGCGRARASRLARRGPAFAADVVWKSRRRRPRRWKSRRSTPGPDPMPVSRSATVSPARPTTRPGNRDRHRRLPRSAVSPATTTRSATFVAGAEADIGYSRRRGRQCRHRRQESGVEGSLRARLGYAVTETSCSTRRPVAPPRTEVSEPAASATATRCSAGRPAPASTSRSPNRCSAASSIATPTSAATRFNTGSGTRVGDNGQPRQLRPRHEVLIGRDTLRRESRALGARLFLWVDATVRPAAAPSVPGTFRRSAPPSASACRGPSPIFRQSADRA